MKKRIGLLAALVAVLLLVLAALPYYLGIQAEESLKRQHAILAQTTFLEVQQHEYRRGWLGATETTVLRFKPSFLAGVQQQLPENIQTILREPITLINTVKHGPFADGLRPVRAHIETEFRFTPEAEKILMRFFGQQAPVRLSNRIGLGGSGQINLHVPAFDYEELSGIKMLWQGLQGQIDYDPDFVAYRSHIHNPGLSMVLADKGEMAYQGLDIRSETRDGQNRLALGNSRLQLKQLRLQWHEGIEYNIKLNELVNLVSDLQIGAFINPNGQVAPAKIVLDDLDLATQMREEGEWIHSEGRFGFARLHYGDTVYGPLAIEAAAEHLHAPSLLALKHKLTELAAQNLSEEAMQAAILQAARTEGLGLFTHDPKLSLKTFRFALPEGEVSAQGHIGFKGLQQADMQQFDRMLAKTEADVQLSLPQSWLEALAIGQARHIFTVDDSAGGEAALKDIDDTVRLMVASTIRVMQQDGYLTVNDGLVQTRIQLPQNRFTLNGKHFTADSAEAEPEAGALEASAVVASSVGT